MSFDARNWVDRAFAAGQDIEVVVHACGRRGLYIREPDSDCLGAEPEPPLRGAFAAVVDVLIEMGMVTHETS